MEAYVQNFKIFRPSGKFLSWIQLCNNKITASVLQFGIRSESFDIGRGCKQGDPLADVTTLFLDGLPSSLQAVLNAIEIYGTLSGFKINMNKTKPVWIGRETIF